MFGIAGIRSRRRGTTVSWWTGECFGTGQFAKLFETKADAEAEIPLVQEYCYPTRGRLDDDGVHYYVPRPRPYAVEIVEAPGGREAEDQRPEAGDQEGR